MPQLSTPHSADIDADAEAVAPTPVEGHIAASGSTCPHCHKPFDAAVDADQPPRFQGAKCPNCRLFVPARHIVDH